MTDEAPADDDLSGEDRIFQILDENPFDEDRLETILNCVMVEVDRQRDNELTDAELRAFDRELRAVVDKYWLTTEKAKN